MNGEARRRFFIGAGATLLLAGCAKSGALASAPASPDSGGRPKPTDDVSPPEDLMREHGVLNRVLLLYEENARRMEAQTNPSIEVVAEGAEIIRRFIEDYHEQLEEKFVFPLFEQRNLMVELVATLRRQHQAGRALTADILKLATVQATATEVNRRQLVTVLGKFVRMYRPHEAREDTVLFPAFRRIVSAKDFDALGERFEDEEHALFGKEGFEGVVGRVADLEKRLGTYELDAYTPV